MAIWSHDCSNREGEREREREREIYIYLSIYLFIYIIHAASLAGNAQHVRRVLATKIDVAQKLQKDVIILYVCVCMYACVSVYVCM